MSRPISTAHEGLDSDLNAGPYQGAMGHSRASQAAKGMGKILLVFSMSCIIMTVAQHSYRRPFGQLDQGSRHLSH